MSPNVENKRKWNGMNVRGVRSVRAGIQRSVGINLFFKKPDDGYHLELFIFIYHSTLLP